MIQTRSRRKPLFFASGLLRVQLVVLELWPPAEQSQRMIAARNHPLVAPLHLKNCWRASELRKRPIKMAAHPCIMSRRWDMLQPQRPVDVSGIRTQVVSALGLRWFPRVRMSKLSKWVEFIEFSVVHIKVMTHVTSNWGHHLDYQLVSRYFSRREQELHSIYAKTRMKVNMQEIRQIGFKRCGVLHDKSLALNQSIDPLIILINKPPTWKNSCFVNWTRTNIYYGSKLVLFIHIYTPFLSQSPYLPRKTQSIDMDPLDWTTTKDHQPNEAMKQRKHQPFHATKHDQHKFQNHHETEP